MCGLNGILTLAADGPRIDREELARSSLAMAARGPDGEGNWLAQDGRFGLAHRRLAIIDPTDAGAQPMVSEDGRFVIVFNGEIYNHAELRGELEGDGETFRSRSDTEVVLRLYARTGPQMLHRLRGMYALAIWDDVERRLFLARDPYGIKPLYYAQDGTTLRFASQVRALTAGGAIAQETDPTGLVGFLLWGSVPEPHTIVRGVRALPAGSSLTISGAVGEPEPHYAFEASDPSVGVHDAIEESVRDHLVADVPVGLFLSAGLDSALVAALAARTHSDMAALTVTFERFAGREDDEGPGAAEVARALGLRHIERRITEEDLEEGWPATLQAADQPSIDGFNTWMVSRVAAEAGLKAVLSGLGGDELFGSYPSFTRVPRLRRLGRIVSVPGIGAVLGRALPLAFRSPKARGIARYATSAEGAYYLVRGLFLPEEIEEMLGAETARRGLDEIGPRTDREEASDDPWFDVHAQESTRYLKNQLLRDADWASMAHSLELRVPLVDVRLREAMAAARFEPVRSEGKARFVRRLAPELPASLFTRRKTGFSVPLPRSLGTEAHRGLGSRRLALSALRAFGIDLTAPGGGSA